MDTGGGFVNKVVFLLLIVLLCTLCHCVSNSCGIGCRCFKGPDQQVKHSEQNCM